ncbi:DUF3048 domain-containing protein [Streptomyces sp. NPDC005921]
MRHRAPTRRTALTAALTAAVLTASLTAGCTRHGTTDDNRAPAPRGTTPAPSEPSAAGSVLAVKIDNVSAARPQTGLDSADVVYAEQVEGGLSRLMAVYATKLPKVVGPVRSARESDLELLRQFDHPTLAFSGAQRRLLPLIDKAPLLPETPGRKSAAFYRGTDHPAPHNLYLRPAEGGSDHLDREAVDVSVRFAAPIPVRPVRLIAEGCGLSRAEVERLLADGQLVSAVRLSGRLSGDFTFTLKRREGRPGTVPPRTGLI